jgi:hypothetical protein
MLGMKAYKFHSNSWPKSMGLFTFLALTLLGIAFAACGNTSKDQGPTFSTGSDPKPSGSYQAATIAKNVPSGYLHNDGDDDTDDIKQDHKIPNDDGELFAAYGRKASADDAQAITKLVRGYFEAVAASDETRACSLLVTALSQGLVDGQHHSSNPKTCQESMSLLFKQQRRNLLTEAEVATMKVISVHVKGNLGLAVLGFRHVPEQELIVERKNQIWKVDALLSSDLT